MSIPLLFARRKFSPRQLFANGEDGVWYDPSDFSNLFQDSAGTTPVTAVEQPVGLIMDESGRGNHASQSTTTSRPILRNRYNLLTYTEQFDNAVWVKDISGTTILNVSANSTTAPDGTTTADTITEVANTNLHRAVCVLTLAPATLTASIYVKNASGNRYVGLSPISSSAAGNNAIAVFDLQNKIYLGTQTAGTSIVGTIVNPTIMDAGNGWFRLSVTGTSTSSSTIFFGVFLYNTFVNNGVNQGNYTGDGTSGIYVWGASLTLANEASFPYQWVTTGAQSTSNPVSTVAAGYDTDLTKFPPYLFFDGIDDWLQTGTINFGATDKLSVFAGIRKLSDAAQNVVAELSASIDSNNGAFLVSAPLSAAANYSFSSKGTSRVNNTVTTYAAPITNVITGLADIAASFNSIRVNQVATTLATSQGTGNFGNYPLYIGRRGGTTLPFNGRIYSLIIRGALTSSPQLDQAERWVASKTGVTL